MNRFKEAAGKVMPDGILMALHCGMVASKEGQPELLTATVTAILVGAGVFPTKDDLAKSKSMGGWVWYSEAVNKELLLSRKWIEQREHGTEEQRDRADASAGGIREGAGAGQESG